MEMTKVINAGFRPQIFQKKLYSGFESPVKLSGKKDHNFSKTGQSAKIDSFFNIIVGFSNGCYIWNS